MEDAALILTSVGQPRTTATLMRSVLTPLDHMNAAADQATKETALIAFLMAHAKGSLVTRMLIATEHLLPDADGAFVNLVGREVAAVVLISTNAGSP